LTTVDVWTAVGALKAFHGWPSKSTWRIGSGDRRDGETRGKKPFVEGGHAENGSTACGIDR
jgi:hypothetical protein